MADKQRSRRRFVLDMARWGGAASLMALVGAPAAAGSGVEIRGVRLSQDSRRTRIVLDMSGPAEHKLFTLTDPERVVLDLHGTRLATHLDGGALRSRLLRRVRHGRRNDGDLRLVLDLDGPAQPKSFLLPPADQPHYRLVIDLHEATERRPAPVVTAEEPDGGVRDVVVAIDPGHGGRDPGAVGRHGTREKDIALAIGLRLEKMLAGEPGVRPVMTRRKDRLVKLRERVRIARAAKADLFISIHADALDNPRVHGASVYALSLRGASSEMARQLAAKENAVDLIGGVTLSDKDEQLASVLLDLSQSATIQSSLELGDALLGQLGAVGRLNRTDVQQAGFAVLKAPDVPSVLVETAFISNPSEERKLRSPAHQERVARAITDGITTYLADKAPYGSVWARRGGTYAVRPGDTLSEIAQEHNTSVSTLKALNGLHDDRVRAGQRLRIPRG